MRKLPFEERKRLSKRIEWLKKDPFDPRLRTHVLTGKLKGYFAFSLSYSKRVTFVWIDKKSILFVDIGSHEEVYR